MKVKDLINKLKKFDSELEIVYFNDEDGFALELNDISEVNAIRTRTNNGEGKALLKFDTSKLSNTYVGFELTSDI